MKQSTQDEISSLLHGLFDRVGLSEDDRQTFSVAVTNGGLRAVFHIDCKVERHASVAESYGELMSVIGMSICGDPRYVYGNENIKNFVESLIASVRFEETRKRESK